VCRVGTCFNALTGKQAIRRDLNGPHPSVPAELEPFLDFVSGISDLPVLRKSYSVPLSKVNKPLDWDYVVPATARALYNVPEGGLNFLNSQ